MAINIFSGSSGRSGGKVNSAQRSERAKAAAAAVAGPAVVSDSGNTAVGAKGVLGRIGSVVGNLASTASKFLPGVGGSIAKGIANIFNDNEWWQEVPGDALTLNEPLRPIISGSVYSHRSAILEFTPAIFRSWRENNSGVIGATAARTAFLTSPKNMSTVRGARSFTAQAGRQAVAKLRVLNVGQEMVTQYLLPQVRHVVNAIPLQRAEAYAAVLEANATAYAVWRNLKKMLYMVQHGTTFIANLDDVAFPLLRTRNAAWLQATINRLEEYLRSNVRLPHTLCEYLAWRFGRTYRSNNSAKSALVQYNVLPLDTPPEVWEVLIADLTATPSSTAELQQANTDLYNTYFDHDYLVEIRDDTQFKFDLKENMLRMNLCGTYYAANADGSYTLASDKPNRLICIDSELSNPETFMASTVSMSGVTPSGLFDNLFPVNLVANVYMPRDSQMTAAVVSGNQRYYTLAFDTDAQYIIWATIAPPQLDDTGAIVDYPWTLDQQGKSSSVWLVGRVIMDSVRPVNDADGFYPELISLMLGKAVGLYNYSALFYLKCATWDGNVGPTVTMRDPYDLSAISLDAGSPSATVIATEHIYAFANLVDIRRKHSLSYKQAETAAANTVANLVDKLDVASVAPSK